MVLGWCVKKMEKMETPGEIERWDWKLLQYVYPTLELNRDVTQK